MKAAFGLRFEGDFGFGFRHELVSFPWRGQY
jgi:hypothetical protein